VQRAVVDAIEEKKRALIAIFGAVGCGKSCLIARLSIYLKMTAEAAIRKQKEAEAAKKTAKKKPAAATGGAAKGAKKKEVAPALPPAQTRVISCFKSPWDSFRDVLMYVLQEVLGPVAGDPDKEELYRKDAVFRQRLSECDSSKVCWAQAGKFV
jgi:hypothetical protein